MQQPGAVRWPQGKRGCMALAFDLDGPTGDAMLNGSLWSTPEYFTFGAYGPFRALGRLLDYYAQFHAGLLNSVTCAVRVKPVVVAGRTKVRSSGS